MIIYKVIGLMSGTSLDGLDLAYCHFWNTSEKWEFKIVKTKNISYKKTIKNQLKNTLSLSAIDLLELHYSYGTWLGKKTKKFIKEEKLEVDFIASHGHTTHHQPKKGFSFQIGSGQHLANASGCKVICDFRINDIALGGQGAPLVPIGDQLLFNNYDFCLNLGGISNISFEKNSQRIAYDIGLANMILNYITQKINLPYDKDGELARKGKLNKKLLKELNELKYYKKSYPKSTGYEWFAKKVIPLIKDKKTPIENLLHTAVHHITEQIATEIQKNSLKEKSTLLVTGGGALNVFLIDTLKKKLANSTEVITPSNQLIEFKEALIFAFMGVLRAKEQDNCLASVTGAQRNCSGGVLFLPSLAD